MGYPRKYVIFSILSSQHICVVLWKMRHIFVLFYLFIPQMILSNWHVSVIVLITKHKVICLFLKVFSFSFFLFVATPHDVWDLSSLTKYGPHSPCRGSNWKLTTESPGKSQVYVLLLPRFFIESDHGGCLKHLL